MNKKDFGYNTDCCCLTDREINQILMKENQVLKDRWKKLKEWANARYNDYRYEGHIVSPETEELDAITNKMQELEDRQ